MASDITEKLRDDLYQKTRSELNTFLDETNALLAAGDALNEDRTTQARERLKDFLARGTSPVTEIEMAAQPALTRAVGNAKSYVTTHPWAAVGVAAGVGLVASLLLKRNRD
ncbi:glycine zipper domain-containing protein [Pseudomonas graminis]|uniref:DUF883 family protein n=1 Tax=Pseudomonas graminis TaxID=158627 RepID=A0A1I0CR89_9PSED|nr:DUF883 family protein [Pseudomonas graminis]SET21759.1 Membrane-anchored ribosome-binding protein, inhibits growth in stationary phase, ElaB/YqjD/DUF883 family [Pseudomonas graminis]